MKGLLVTLVVLVALAVGADRVAAAAAERVIAAQAQSSGGLAERPAVDVRGFPFLTQALAGRYDDVRLTATGDLGAVDVERLDVELFGVRVPLSDALSGDVSSVPVDGVQGEVLLSYAELSRRAPDGVRVAREGDRLRVTGTVEVLGRALSASVLSRVRLDDGAVVVRAEEVEGAGAELPLSRLADRFDFRVAVDDLPYGLALTGLRVRPEGLALAVRSGPTVLAR